MFDAGDDFVDEGEEEGEKSTNVYISSVHSFHPKSVSGSIHVNCEYPCG